MSGEVECLFCGQADIDNRRTLRLGGWQPIEPDRWVCPADRNRWSRLRHSAQAQVQHLLVGVEDPRTAWMVALRAEGLSLEAIGDEVGLTRERVRQILKAPTKKPRRVRGRPPVRKEYVAALGPPAPPASGIPPLGVRIRLMREVDGWTDEQIAEHFGWTVDEVGVRS